MNQTQQPTGFVRRFSDYNAAQMAQLKKDLELQMPHSHLNLCAAYFRAAKRDPSIAELRFLDALAALSPRVEAITLSELYTNDSFVARTYADMMNKRRELHPEATEPVSLGEALGMASAYLERAGKCHNLDGFAPVFTEAEALCDGSVCAEGASAALSVSDYTSATELSEGDLFLLIHRGNTPMWQYRDRIGGFLASDAVRETAKRIFTVPAEGLLPMLLPICNGICYNLPALSPDGHSVTAGLLMGKFSEYRVLALRKSDAESVSKLASSMGFRALAFAAVMNGKQTTILYSHTESLSYETAFLRQLLARQTAVAKLPAEKDTATTEISHIPMGLHNCPYLADFAALERVNVGENCSASVACGSISESPFRSAMQTALTALLSTAVSAGGYTCSRFALSLRCPPMGADAEKMGETIAMILGVYRLQCELSVPAAITSIQTDTKLSRPELNVFSFSTASALPSTFTKRGNRLYCVTPALGKDGLPDFNALRSLLKELAEFCRQGDIQSFRVVCNERITDVAALMETSALTCHLTNPEALVGGKLPLAILLEASCLLPYGNVGYVTDRQPESVLTEEIRLPKLTEALNRGDRYEVVIFSKQKDVGAAALAQYLRKMGVVCTRQDETVSESLLSRAVLGAQILFLCGDVTIPQGGQTEFALRVLREAGGIVLQLGKSANSVSDHADHTLPDGISGEILMQIAMETDDLKSFS